MTKLRPHPNVCQILGISVNENRMLLVMEYCRRGSLSDYWGKDSIDMDKKLKIISGVASGIRHLHSNMIVHRDIAASTCTFPQDASNNQLWRDSHT
jgi:serine/threonine protein kinase